jgi:hypothetical protein
MAIAFDNSIDAFGAAAITTLESASFTVGSGSDRILMVGVLSGAGTPVDPSAVKWGGSSGTSLTQVGATVNIGSNVKLSLWRLVNPSAGASTIHVTWGSAQDERALVAASYTGVDQTTPLGTAATATGASSSAITVNVSSAAGDLVVDAAGFLDDGGANRTLAVGADQTSRAEVEGADLGFEGLGMSEEAGAATVTMSWTISAAVNAWGTIGVALKPAAGGGATIYTRRPLDSPIFNSRILS